MSVIIEFFVAPSHEAAAAVVDGGSDDYLAFLGLAVALCCYKRLIRLTT
ncbi:hypothetical protein ACFCYB_41635 [Streptomyces sp. NPDC056309]